MMKFSTSALEQKNWEIIHPPENQITAGQARRF